MDLLSVFTLLRRRKSVAIPSAILVAVVLAATVVVVPPTYRAGTTMVLLNPPLAPEPKLGETQKPSFQNPYVGFGDISVVVDIVRRIMASAPVLESLRVKGLAGTFTVAANVDFARGPLIDIAAEAPSDDGAINDVGLVLDELKAQLAALQTAQGTDPKYFISAQVVVPATRATTVFSATLRRLIAVAGLGTVVIFGAVLIADAIARRERRKSAKLTPPSELAVAPPPVDTNGATPRSRDPRTGRWVQRGVAEP